MSDPAIDALAGIYYDAFGVPEHLRTTDVDAGYPFFFYLVGILGAASAHTVLPNPLVIGAPDGIGPDDNLSGPDGTPGWATALAVETVPSWWVPWLGQFVGVAVPAAASASEALDMVRRREGWQRGTPATLLAVARRYLKDPNEQHVYLFERTTSAYTLGVRVFKHDLSDATYTELGLLEATYALLSAAYPIYADMEVGGTDITTALNAAKPAGLVMTVAIVPGGATYAALTGAYATYTLAAGAFPTYWDMIDHE